MLGKRAMYSTGGRPLPGKRVELMGKERWKKFLRFLICFIIVFLMMIYISQKVC